METRDTDEFGGHFLVDYSGVSLKDTGRRHGQHAIVESEKEEREMQSLEPEKRLMKAMNEIRKMNAKNMSPRDRAMFSVIVEGILKENGITVEFYNQYLKQLGTPQDLRRR